MTDFYKTPEEAAIAGWDPRYARVVRTVYHAPDKADVELATNEEPYLYPYLIRCVDGPHGWSAVGDGNGPAVGW